MPTDIQRSKWNAFVTRQIAKATTLFERLYWETMYV
jgi:hypothetical protein